jgi:DNA-binding winged helix-turn-helix (wHTH) protein/tetratricopeptide (TPR) repeat protein
VKFASSHFLYWHPGQLVEFAQEWNTGRRFVFSDYEFDPQTGDLQGPGEKVRLPEQTSRFLTILLERSGTLVSREELRNRLWPDGEFLNYDHSINNAVGQLRALLGDERKTPRFLETITKRGYRFLPEVETKVVRSEEEVSPEKVCTSIAESLGYPSPAPASPAAADGQGGGTAQVRMESSADLLPEMGAGDTLVHSARERTHVVIEEAALAPVAEKTTRASTRAWPYALVVMAVLALAVWAGWRWWPRAAPADFYKVVVADFANTTGDATFDQTLKRALEIDLEQSPFLDVMSEREAVGTLQLMGQKADAAITANVATELCVRSNRQVLVTGSIASVGRSYLLTLVATDCASGKKLASAKKLAATKEEVLGAIDAVADRIRKGLGEFPKSLESFQVPIEKATTPSLEALKVYSLGKYLNAQGKGELETLPFFQKAVELDPKFAMAYDAIANDYFNLNQYSLAGEYYKKAFELSGHVSEREKFGIQGHYEKDVEQRIKLFQLWAATYPYDSMPWFDLASSRMDLGQFAAAIPAASRALELDPNRWFNYFILARAYECANRFTEAKAVGAQAVQRKKDPVSLHATLFEIAFAEQDESALSRETQWSENHVDDYYLLVIRAWAAAALGKYRESEELFHRSYESAIHENLPETADNILLFQAIMEFDFGLPAISRATLGRSRKPDFTVDLAILRAKLGDTSYAEHYLSDHGNETNDRLMAYVYVPLVRATLAMKRQKPLDAIAALEPATPYEVVDYNVPILRGEACLRAHHPEMAAVEYQKVLANRGLDPVSHLYPLARLGLARAYALQNHKAESREEYEKFFAFWKDADADVPVLKQARLEYARFQ